MWLKHAVSSTSDTGAWVPESSLPLPAIADFDRRFESGLLEKAGVFWMNLLLFECAPDTFELINKGQVYTDETRPVDGVHYKLIKDLEVEYQEFPSLKSLNLTWFWS